MRWRGKEGRWEEVALILWLGRLNRYWPGNKLLWMEILADELSITQQSSENGRRAAQYSASGESDYREVSCLVQLAPAKMEILKASLPVAEKDCTPSHPVDPQVGNASVPSQVG